MPMYEYRCQSCGNVFEVRQKFADEPVKVHEGCGGAVQRLISAPAFQFKGSGWYVTDYARSNGKNGDAKNGSDSNKDTKTESKSEAKSESKSESKPATSSTSDSK